MNEQRARAQGGLPSYQGYEYQIEVTIWVGLQLMLEHGSCDSIEVEPASEEDIQAMLDVPPEDALSRIALPGRRELQIQIKLRSRPFLANDFKNLVSPSAPRRTGKGGPPPRQRPIDYLREHEAASYVLITSAQVDATLAQHVIHHLEAKPTADALPFTLQNDRRYSREEQAELAQRLGILHQQVPEVVRGKISRALLEIGFVPFGHIDECLQNLKAHVRDRLLGRASRTWPLAELKDVIQQHGGLPRKPHDKFVKPDSYGALIQQLEQHSALILIGPRGVGKSTTAEMLAHEHRTRSDPFEVIASCRSPAELRDLLSRPGRFLFLLEDPLGATSNTSFEADLWAKDLPYLMGRANSDKRLLMTSRASIFKKAYPSKIPSTLQRLAQELQPENYGLHERWELLMHMLRGDPIAEDFAAAHREEILATLQAPFSLHILGAQLRNKQSLTEAELKTLLHGSLMETLGMTVAAEARGWGDEQRDACLLMGFLLDIRKTFTEADVEQVLQSLRTAKLAQIEFRTALKHLVRAGWVVQRDGGYWAHPQVVEGLTGLFEDAPERAAEILVAWMKGLVADGRHGPALVLSFALTNRDQRIPPELQGALDAFLIHWVQEADDANFHDAFRRLAILAQGNAPEALLSRRLARLDRHSSASGYPEPPVWSASEEAALRDSASARLLMARYIRHGWMRAQEVCSWEMLSSWIDKLGWNFHEEITLAARAALGDEGWYHRQATSPSTGSGDPFGAALSQLLRGALEVPGSSIEEYLELCLDALARARAFCATARRQDEHAGLLAAHGALRATELALLPRAFELALETAVDVRRVREGYEWIRVHPRRREVVPAFNASIGVVSWPGTSPLHPRHLKDRPAGTLEEVLTLYDACDPADRRSVWRLMLVIKAPEFLPLLLRDLEDCPLEHLGKGVEILRFLSPETDALQKLSALRAKVDFTRRVALAEAWRPRDAGTLPGLSDEELVVTCLCTSALAGRLSRSDVDAVSLEQQALLWNLAEKHPGMFGGGALLVLAYQGTSIDSLSEHIQALALAPKLVVLMQLFRQGVPSARSLLRSHIQNKDPHLRRLALEELAPSATTEERAELLQLAADPNAVVRNECAFQIGIRDWADGVKWLLPLVTSIPGDEALDASFNLGASPIGRTAANALALISRLTDATVAECMNLMRRGPEAIPDVVVRCELVRILARSQLAEGRELLLQCLESYEALPGNNDSRRFPLRYAGAWGLFRHLRHYPQARDELNMKQILKAAKHPDIRLAGPALLILGFSVPVSLPAIRDVFGSPAVTPKRKLLAVAGAALAGTRIPDDLMNPVAFEQGPGLVLLEHARAPESADSATWESFMEKNPEVSAWLTLLGEPEETHRLLRWVFFELLGRRARRELPWSSTPPETVLAEEASLRLLEQLEWRGSDIDLRFW
ncbi:hypothetical protein JYK02_37290 [Corallococcus macrosporus]|uniref:Novel STAND NTPase 3 domain-containing protein n=1 Tax=Corallococcus macrosporus TaxID=35 RepID=A0ABS3DPD9_9BACT|nr:hypothetical protein [Corallococcus macrosporus]MBN8233184.1 hypothetical protein [Corallococcus macrosporus]